jgi:hypothetical protein
VETLLEELNKKAKTKKQCKSQVKKANKTPGEKDDKKAENCYRGYQLVIAQQEADLEFFGDFDNNHGPDGLPGQGPNNAGSPGGGALPPCDALGAPAVNPGADDTGIPIGLADPGPGPAAANLDLNGDTGACTPSGAPTSFAADPFVGTGPGGTGADCPDTVGGLSPATSTCLLHGIDKGAGVKTSNSSSANFANKLTLPLAGGAATVNFTRGWTATDAKVRGKSFRFVNTHLESESAGSIREDQASELIAAGGHGELLSDQSDLLGDGWIDHILTNNPGSIKKSGNAQVIDSFANGLWNSDHGGVFIKIKGKKRND